TLARHLETKNRERRTSVTAILNGINFDPAAPLLVAGQPDWSLGVLGLAASRLAEEWRRPVFLWGQNGRGEIKGSCRSDGSVNLVELMKRAHDTAGDLFLNFGGHIGAGGFSLAADRLADLASSLLGAHAEVEKLVVSHEQFFDHELSFDAIGEETYRALVPLAPFGVDNPKPIFLFPNLKIERARRFGTDNNHLELFFPHARLGRLSAIQFFVGARDVSIPTATARIDLLATLEKSFFRSTPELRLRIIDWREAIC
ncbi:MAG: DHHA1 domain-containing protein, partial [Patescibacteria group bacterium]